MSDRGDDTGRGAAVPSAEERATAWLTERTNNPPGVTFVSGAVFMRVSELADLLRAAEDAAREENQDERWLKHTANKSYECWSDEHHDECLGVCSCVCHRQAAAHEKGKAWKETVIDFCVLNFLEWDENDPRGTLLKLIAWEQTIALDPAVSKQAADLVEEGRQDGREEEREACARFIETHYPVHETGPRLSRWRMDENSDSGKIQSTYAAAIRARAEESK